MIEEIVFRRCADVRNSASGVLRSVDVSDAATEVLFFFWAEFRSGFCDLFCTIPFLCTRHSKSFVIISHKKHRCQPKERVF